MTELLTITPADLTAEDIDQVRAASERFLLSRHVALWGQAFDVVAEDSRQKAADWLTHTIVDFLTFVLAEESTG